MQLPAGKEVILRQHPSCSHELHLRHHNADDANSAVEVYLQAGMDVRPTSVIVELIAQIVHKAAEQQLRTVEQLGYIVWCTVRVDVGVIGLRFIIQSSNHNAAHLDERIEAFLDTVPDILSSLTQEEFDDYQQALLDIKLEKDKKLREESSRYWAEIVPYGTYDFERDQRDAKAIEALSKQTLSNFWRETFARESPNRRKLSSQVFAAHHALPPPPPRVNAVVLDTLEEQHRFKRSLCAFPTPDSVKRN